MNGCKAEMSLKIIAFKSLLASVHLCHLESVTSLGKLLKVEAVQ